MGEPVDTSTGDSGLDMAHQEQVSPEHKDRQQGTADHGVKFKSRQAHQQKHLYFHTYGFMHIFLSNTHTYSYILTHI